MSIKKLFEKHQQGKRATTATSKGSLETLSEGVESQAHYEELNKKRQRVEPHVDYLNPEEFVKYGSAERYYEDAFTNIASNYPYDGSSKEKLKFRNSLTLLENDIFNKIYPKSTGYITIGRNYGTKASHDSGYHSASEEYIRFNGSAQVGSLYSTDTGRTSNLDFGGPDGSTVEFFLKKEAFDIGISSPKEVILDIWNNESGLTEGRFRVEIHAESRDRFMVTYRSGSQGVTAASVPANGGLTLSGSSWNHYAFAIATGSGAGLEIDLYQNGVCVSDQVVTGSAIDKVYGVYGALGALVATEEVPATDDVGASTAPAGYGKLSASLDEFRFWKTKRTGTDIGRFWFDQTHGATNSSSLNSDLGVYYRFNEGITGYDSQDRTILDCSGRIANGTWEGFEAQSRSTGSAVTEMSLGFTEEESPIIYTNHPDYLTAKTRYVSSGSQYDWNNHTSLTHAMPSWIAEEDESTGKHLQQLTQVMASQFDTLHAQIGHFAKIKEVSYSSGSNKPFPYNELLVESLGLEIPELFENAPLLTRMLNRSEDALFEQDISDVKNLIYKNIYNNLSYIYKAKGTEKSFRNLIRCFGIDDDVLSLSTYADNTKYKLETTYRPTTSEKKFVDFSGLRRELDTAASVYQYYDSSNPNSRGLITGSGKLEDFAFSIEGDFLFPQRPDINHINYRELATVSSSLFGFHTPANEIPTSTVLTWAPAISDYGLQVYAVRKAEGFSEVETDKASKNVTFVVIDRAGNEICASPVFSEVYDNNRWNLSLSVRPTGYPNVSEFPNYTVELYGTNYSLGIKQNSFTATAEFTDTKGSATISSTKRIYVGAHRTDFNGGLLCASDIRASSIRYWQSYLQPEVVDLHARDVDSYGQLHPYRNEYLFPASASHYVPAIESLAMNWDFAQVAAADVSGQFVVSDYSSGSADTSIVEANYASPELNEIISRQHTGRGDFFLASDTPVRKEYLYTERQQLPEQIYSSDMINVLSQDDNAFTIDSRPIKYIFAVEKSMYDSISRRMLGFFASIDDFNNLIGEPVNRYRQDYKDIGKLREIFFRRIGNTPDLDKYVEYYKWIDAALGQMIEQLFPASAGVPEDIRNIVESHILERNKYAHKYQHLKYRLPVLESGIQGVNRLMQNWKHLHAPLGANAEDQRRNCQWWKDLAERQDGSLSEGLTEPEIHTRRMIHSASLGELERSLTAPYRFAGIDLMKTYGAAEYNKLRIHTANSAVYDQFDLPVDCHDDQDLIIKKRLGFRASIDGQGFNGRRVAPFSAHSSSVTTGYRNLLDGAGLDGVDITNLHEDSTPPNYEVSMQGPFTERHVGGLQYRHANPLEQDSDLRPEGFLLTGSGGTLTLMGAHNPASRPFGWKILDREVPQGRYYRDGVAKRPVNIRNIQSVTNEDIAGDVRVLGNFTKNYEIVQTSDRSINNLDLRKNPSNYNITSQPSPYIAGAVDYTIPQRSANKTVIVEQFSAPGGVDVNTPAFMDLHSQQYAPNNALPFRNQVVRQPLNSLLRTRCGWGGLTAEIGNDLLVSGSYTLADLNAGSIGIPIASFHKTQRNTTKRLIKHPTADDSITGSISDNEFVTRPVPSADRYSWFNDIIAGASTDGPLWHTQNSQAQEGQQGNVSLYNQYIASGSRMPENVELPTGSNQFGPGGVASHDDDDHGVHWVDGKIRFKWQKWQNFPVFKQLRVGETNQAKIIRQNNTYTKHQINSQGVRTSTDYTEPVVTTGHKPIVITIRSKESTPDDDPNVSDPYDVTLIHSYGNEHASFANEALDTLNGSSIRHQRKLDVIKPYDVISRHRREGTPSELTGIDKFKELVYVETLYPKEENTYSSTTRARQSFGVGAYWKDSLSETSDGYSTINGWNNYAGVAGSSSYSGSITMKAYHQVRFNNRPGDRIEHGLLNSQGWTPTWRQQAIFRTSQSETQLSLGMDPEEIYKDPVTKLGHNYGLTSVWPMDSFAYAGHMATAGSDGLAESDLFLVQGWGAGELMAQRWYSGFAGWFGHPESGLAVWPGANQGTELSGCINPLFFQVPILATDTSEWRSTFPSMPQYIYQVPTVKRVPPPSVFGTFNSRGETVYTSGIAGKFLTSSVHPYSPGGSPSRPAWKVDTKRKYVDGSDRGELAPSSTPMFGVYGDFAKDLRKIAPDFGTIPEYRVSEHIASQENLRNFNDGLLTLTGSQGGVENSSQTGFMSKYAHADLHKQLKKFMIDDFASNNVPTDFGLKIEAYKKLLPYEGLYPVLRTTQMASLFSGSYAPTADITFDLTSEMFSAAANEGGSVDITETKEAGRLAGWQSILTPFFAPGILYNSIKSGIAVDFPSRIYDSTTNHDLSDTQWGGVFTLSAEYGDPRGKFIGEPLKGCLFGAQASGSALPTSYSDSDGQKMYWPSRMPFEGILEPEKYIGSAFDKELCVADVNYYLMAPGVTGALGAPGNNLYKKAMSNFLAATPDFFLEGESMTSFVARPEDANNITVDPRKVYAMEVVMKKTDNFNMYSNPYAFGPPTATGSDGWDGLTPPSANATAAGRPEGQAWPLHRGEFAPFTPPYYYGESIARLVFVPDKETYTLNEILENVSVQHVNANSYQYDFHHPNSLDGGIESPEYGWNRAWLNRMDIDASVVIDNNFATAPGVTTRQSDRWVIAPRWECPILDFPKDGDLPYNFSSSIEPGTFKEETQGMWHQYGIMPSDSPNAPEGVYLFLRDIEYEHTDRILSGSSESSNTMKGAITNIPKLGSIPEADIASLASLVNFEQVGEDNKKKLGKMAATKEINEAVIAIPYYIKDGESRFIEIGSTQQLGPELRKFRNSFHKYNLPPGLETLLAGLTPDEYPGQALDVDLFNAPAAKQAIAMYLFEFTTTLTRQDLADIWQGVLPDVSKRAEFEVISIDHAMPLRNENNDHDLEQVVRRIDHRLKDIMDVSRRINFANGNEQNGHPGFEPEIRWMIFKTKKRAPTSYYDMMYELSTGESRSTGQAAYESREKSYNWPYDYFSLVELGKMTSRTKFRPDVKIISEDGISDFGEDE